MTSPSTARGRILLVSDDSVVRLSLTRALESEGFCVSAANNESDGLQRFDPKFIDLVLLDLDCARNNGWLVFDRLTAVHPLRPIMIITARPDQYAPAERAGAAALMEKPLLLPLLLETLDQLVQSIAQPGLPRFSRGPQALASQPAEGVEAWR